MISNFQNSNFMHGFLMSPCVHLPTLPRSLAHSEATLKELIAHNLRCKYPSLPTNSKMQQHAITCTGFAECAQDVLLYKLWRVLLPDILVMCCAKVNRCLPILTSLFGSGYTCKIPQNHSTLTAQQAQQCPHCSTVHSLHHL